MKTLFEMKRERPSDYIAAIDVPVTELPKDFKKVAPDLPELSEVTVERHYSALSRAAFGVDDGSYLLGSCTMKYNPKLNERVAALKGFTDIHPLAPESDVQGAMELIYDLGEALKEITGMDAMTFQPAAGAHGEYTGLKIIDAYHKSRGEVRTKILVPDSAHGTNRPGDMGFDVVHLNLHKTFSTPHGGGGPGAGPVGVKAFLKEFLPSPAIEKAGEKYVFAEPEKSIGKVNAFYGNFSVLVKAYAYILSLGKRGIPDSIRQRSQS